MAQKAASSIQDWLESLDLGHFTANFHVNGVTQLHQACHLTEDQLNMLGITQRGYQKRILNHLPTQAQALLSEFVVNTEKENHTPMVEAPMPPPRVNARPQSKENGHNKGKKPMFDDETYLMHPPSGAVDVKANSPIMPPRKSAPNIFQSQDMDHQLPQKRLSTPSTNPSVPPRCPSPRTTANPEVLPKQSRDVPRPQPRARPEPSTEERPPPLPDRRERPESRPVPKQRPGPKAPPPVDESHSLLKLSSPAEHFPMSEQNIYLDNFPTAASPLAPSVQFLSPPQVLPLPQSQGYFGDNVDDDSLPNLPPPPPPKSSPSPKIIKRDIPEAPPPARPDSSSISSGVGSHSSDSSSVKLPAYEFDDFGPPSLPPPPPPPKASGNPFPSAVSTSVHGQESLPVLPPPAPPRESSPPIGSCPPMPPKHHDTTNMSALPRLSSDLSAPPLPSEETPVQSVPAALPQPQKSSFNPFDSTNIEKQITFSDTLNIAQFDPLSTEENAGEFYPDALTLRPPSLFCNPETFDHDLSFPLPPVTPPPQPPSLNQPSPVLSPSMDPELTMALMSRPVPLPPASRRGSHPPTPPTRDLVSKMPHLPDRTPNRSLSSADLDLRSSQLTEKTVAPNPTEPYLPQEAVLEQQPRSSSQADSWQGTALPAKSSLSSLANQGPVPGPPAAPVRQNTHQSPVPVALPSKSSDLVDLEGHAVMPNTTGNGKEGSVDQDFRSDQGQSTFNSYSLATTQDDLEDQYSKIIRSSTSSTPKDVETFGGSSGVSEPPSHPPPIPPRLDPQGEAEPSLASIPRPSPIGANSNDDNYSFLTDAESRPISGASSDRHSYILLSESISGVTEEHPAIPKEPFMPTLTTPFEEAHEAGAPLQYKQEKIPPKPVRRAPPPPVAKQSPSHTPKAPTRAVPMPPMRHSSPTLPPILNEDEYDLLDANVMRQESPPQDEPMGSAERYKFAFKELAQNEESGDDDDSGFDMDSLSYSKASVLEDCDSVDLADRRNKIQDHVMRMGQKWQREPETNDHPPVRRTHSRAIDEKTRHSLSQKLSQSLQDRNSTAEVQSSAKAVQLSKSGYLWKQGGKQNNKGFRKRWVVFNGSEIRYFENEQSLSECKGIIPVGTMRDVKNLCGTAKFGDGKHNRIIVETTGRSFHFAAETLVEGTLWANTLMQSILSYKTPPGGFPVGGDMSCPDKMGYIKIDGYRTKRFLVIKGEMLCIYNTEMDFESAIAISDIQMKLASVKELPKNKIQLATPPKIYTLAVDSPTDVKEWIETMKEAIQEGLSDHSSLEKIQQNPSNKYCADCRMKDPDWASINLAIVVCKNCSGLHRNLGVQLSKVRSLKMDTKVWTPMLVHLMIELGNSKSNQFWEANLNEGEKAVPDDTLERRQVYIINKYKDKKYCKPNSVDKNMDKTLVKAASLGDLDECIRLVFFGANVSYTREDGKTAYDVAMASKFLAVAEFLQQNIGLHIVPTKNDSAPVNLPKCPPKNDKAAPVMAKPTRESKQEFVKKEGYLHKTGNNKKEFQRRYCTLEHGIFSYYDDRSQPPKNTIEGIDMVLIATAEQRPGHKYCFEIYTSVGRTYLLSAETEEDRREWMIVLAKIHSLECMWQTLEEFEQAGFLHKKEGAAATNWQRLWFILKGKSLVSYSVVHDKLEEIDLRKLISLSRQDSDIAGASDYNHTLSIVLPGMNIYLRAETKQAADCWYEEINKVTMRKGQALEDQSLTRDNVPIIVSQCIGFVATHEGVMTEGIYRLSGTSSVIRKIVATYNEDPRTARLVEEYSVHDVTGALKKFFRELPDPLLTSKLYKQWTEVVSYKDHSARLQWHQHLLSELPPVNFSTLKMLIGHLKNVADNSEFNKMYVRNLAAVFGPTLMASSDSTFVHAENEIAVIADLLTYYAWLFGVSDEEMAKEREKELKYQQGLEKIKAARASEAFADEQLIMVEIFMGKREPTKTNSINIKMSMDHTAEEVVKIALEQQKQIDDGSWAMFEVIAKGELQRLIHGYEKVLPQILSWNQQMAADNYICIKHNTLLEKIEPYMDHATLTDLVKFSESKKSFKKYTFELVHNMITCYKEKSSTASYVWKVADMKIYTGVEKKRSPPSQWGISFTINNEEGLKAMCLDSESSYYFWLAGLLKSKKEASSNSGNAEHEGSSVRQSRYLPRDLSSVVGKMSFWRKSRMSSMDDS